MPTVDGVTLDIIEGARVRYEGNRYVEAVRTAVVDLTGFGTVAGGAFNEDQLLAFAVQHLQLPPIGTPHAHFPGLSLQAKAARPQAGQSRVFRVELIYKRLEENAPPAGHQFEISVSSTAQQIETMVDRGGVPITVEWTPPGASMAKVQGAVIHPDVAGETISLSETFQSGDPTAVTRVWTNATNQGSFFYDQSASGGEWRITFIGAVLVDGFTIPFPTWRFTYQIVKKPEIITNVVGGHNPQVYYVDDNGDPPVGLMAGTGYKTVDWYFQMNFANLFG